MSKERKDSRKQTIFGKVVNLIKKEPKIQPTTKEIEGIEQEAGEENEDLSFLIRKSINASDPDIFKKTGKIYVGKKGKNLEYKYSQKLCQLTATDLILSEEQGKDSHKYSLDSFVLQRIGNMPVKLDKKEEMGHVFAILFPEKEIFFCTLTLQELADWIEAINMVSMKNFANETKGLKFISKKEEIYNKIKDEFKIYQEVVSKYLNL